MSPRSHNSRPGRWSGVLTSLLGVDARTLAAARVAVGLVLLMNLVTRAVDLPAMYSDAGILPRSVVRDFYQSAGAWRWSLHMLGGSTEFQAILFAIAVVLAMALLVGYRTRLATMGSWLLLASLHVRMPLLVTGGDVLLCMLLFWGMFLPWGGTWSLDARRREKPEREPGGRQVLSPASAAILLQVGLMYLMTGWGKCNAYWFSGEAIQNALSYDMIARPLGQQLLRYPELLKLLTWATLLLELAGPLLLFFPIGTRYVRPLTVPAFVALHVGIELTMRVTVFSFASLAALVLFLPGAFWEWPLVRRWTTRWDRTASMGSTFPVEKDVVQGGRPDKSWWTRTLECLQHTVVVLVLAYVVFYNVGWQLAGDAFLRWTPTALDRVTDLAMLGQRWTMFVEPHALDYRFAAVARLRDGQVVDVLRDGAAVDFLQAREWPARMRSQRWMLAFRELADDRNNWFRQSAADYFFRNWNATRPQDQQIEMLDLLQVQVKPWVSGSAGPAMIRLGRVDALEQGPYRNGLRHGHWTLRREDGSLASEGTYRHGLRQGPWVFYHPNGRKSAEGPYHDDKMNGKWTHWLPDGRPEGQGTYTDNRMNGTWVFAADDGQSLCVEYDNDRPVSSVTLSRDSKTPND
jgi:hypothetical protein